jgi:hypothetical protein
MRSQSAAKSVHSGDSESIAAAHQIFQRIVSRFRDDTRVSFSQSRKFFGRN